VRTGARDPHGRRWIVQRRVLAWAPHLRLRWLIDDLPLKGTTVDAPPDVTTGVRTLTNVQAAQTRGLTYGSVMFLVELPLLVVQAAVWALLALATLCYKTARKRPWAITGVSEYPTPKRFVQDVVGWRASRARVHELAIGLNSGIEPRSAR
jgi:hypothetical protein